MYPCNYNPLKCKIVNMGFPPQHQPMQPGIEYIMVPLPVSEDPNYIGSNKLQNKVAIITGGDSGIGRAVAIAFAKEGADVCIVYLSDYESPDALETQRRVNAHGRKCLTIRADVRNQANCNKVVEQTMKEFGKIDILVNNVGASYNQPSIEAISQEQLEDIFRTNVYSSFYMVKASLPYMRSGAAIINNISVTAFEGAGNNIDYSSSKGAALVFTKSLAQSLVHRGIRVNGVAPGMTWTPLVPANMTACETAYFGTDRPMGRAAQPFEVAPAFVFLASNISSSYITGQVIIVS